MDLIKVILLVESLAAVTSYHLQFTVCSVGFIDSWNGGVHMGNFNPRIYQHGCTSMTYQVSNCSSFSAVNAYLADFDFACPEGAMSIVSSWYSDALVDRTFSFSCCIAAGMTVGQCVTSDYINDWQETYNYTAPEGTVIRGVQSIFNNTLKDRRWKMETCSVIPNKPC